jgi:hypothetical protein
MRVLIGLVPARDQRKAASYTRSSRPPQSLEKGAAIGEIGGALREGQVAPVERVVRRDICRGTRQTNGSFAITV